MSLSDGIVAVTDLPSGSSITLDGIVKILQRDDFVGISNVPRDVLHLVILRGSVNASNNDSGDEITKKPSMLASGLVILKESDGNCDGWTVAHKFDTLTEEVSLSPLDTITIQNMRQSVRNNSIGVQRFIEYEKFVMSGEGSAENTWNKGLVNLVTSNVLKRLRLKGDGDKIVPSCYRDIYDEENYNPAKESDGKSIIYPPIPCLNFKIGHRRVVHHEGTKRYLAKLSPSERTALFVNPDKGDQLLKDVLSKYYENKWEILIGELQFAFVVFITMSCLSSFEHWRDIISMISFSSEVSVNARTPMFIAFIRTIICQMKSFDLDFFQETQYTEGNFFVPAIQRIFKICSSSSDATLKDQLTKLSNSFQASFFVELSRECVDGDFENIKPERDELDETENPSTHYQVDSADLNQIKDGTNDDDDDDEDLPQVVPLVEVEASFARFNPNKDSMNENFTEMEQNIYLIHKEKFPLLFSAILSHEDVVMACARILDEKNDVSLVREASAYLQEVEAKK